MRNQTHTKPFLVLSSSKLMSLLIFRQAKENTAEPLIEKANEKLESIGKHCTRDNCGRVFFKQVSVRQPLG